MISSCSFTSSFFRCRDLTAKFMQIIKFIERILYATDEREAKEAMLEAQSLYAGAEA